MTNLVRAELYKIRTTRLFLWVSLAAAGLIGFVLFVQLAVSVEMGGLGGEVAGEADLRQLLDVGGVVGLFALVFGATAIPTEIRYRTITPAFLATPARWRVVLAKTISYAIAGALMAVAAEVIATVVVVGWLLVTGATIPWGPTVWVALALGPVATGLITILGVAVGAVVPNPVGAVLIAAGWVLLIEQLLANLIAAAAPWLPFYGLFRAITGEDLDPGRLVAFVALAGYVLVLSVMGGYLVDRRDVA